MSTAPESYDLTHLIDHTQAEIRSEEWREREATKTAREARTRRGALVQELADLQKLREETSWAQ